MPVMFADKLKILAKQVVEIDKNPLIMSWID